MTETPALQNSAPASVCGICRANSSLKRPWTIEMWTPAFSKTRPCSRPISPPPPSGRDQGLISKLPGGSVGVRRRPRPRWPRGGRRGRRGPAGTRRRRSAFLASMSAGRVMSSVSKSSVWRRASPNISAAASATLIERKPARIGMRTRRSASAATSVGHAGALAAEHQDVVVGDSARHRPTGWPWWSAARGGGRHRARQAVEMGVAVVLDDLGLIEIVERRRA